jgi:hypothetical protein
MDKSAEDGPRPNARATSRPGIRMDEGAQTADPVPGEGTRDSGERLRMAGASPSHPTFELVSSSAIAARPIWV